ncbi:Sporulation and spore germination [Caloramator mitchellensis]|uniref:Sporulation and spore germination n=1 Tax=Caloramator mitchellensis TaxID=908809 RepID=A0A0R3JZR5_CALMK|nr:GerMN domain-containing protein [Caloramator mitchellensis]KRQ86476.1 Sporulation and spore germination [Caloramator mitchellensis]
MKKVVSTLLLFFLILGCKKVETKTEGINIEQKKQMVNIILFFPDRTNKFLKAEARDVVFDKSLERTILNELIKGPKTLGLVNAIPNGTRILSINKNEDILVVNLSNEFIKNHPGGIDKERATLYSIVNSLTEIPGVKGVQFQIGGRKYDTYKGNISINAPLRRNRDLFIRDKKMLPNEVLKLQMNLEKQGKWLEAYLLMSDDENNTYRKYFDDYVKEMEESKALGFLNADFVVDGYTLDPSKLKARVKVNFYEMDASGKKILGKDLYFTVVKINGAWMVDWLTAQ